MKWEAVSIKYFYILEIGVSNGLLLSRNLNTSPQYFSLHGPSLSRLLAHQSIPEHFTWPLGGKNIWFSDMKKGYVSRCKNLFELLFLEWMDAFFLIIFVFPKTLVHLVILDSNIWVHIIADIDWKKKVGRNRLQCNLH